MTNRSKLMYLLCWQVAAYPTLLPATVDAVPENLARATRLSKASLICQPCSFPLVITRLSYIKSLSV